jgi:hypothetical protein
VPLCQRENRAEIAVSYARKIVLHCPCGPTMALEYLIEQFIQDGVVFVGVVGPGCSRVESLIDDIVVRDDDRDYFMLTSSHPDESIGDAVKFARSLTGEYEGEVQLVELK